MLGVIQICMETLGERVRQLRRTRGWSQQQLADRTGGQLDQTAISRIETRQGHEPGVFTAVLIARAFSMTVDELVSDLKPLAVGADETESLELDARLAGLEKQLREIRSLAKRAQAPRKEPAAPKERRRRGPHSA